MKLRVCKIMTFMLLFLMVIALPASGAVYNYDALGRLTSASDDFGNEIIYIYDAGGNLVKAGKEDKIPPLVSASDPDDNAIDVSVDKIINITFSEQLLPADGFINITLKAGNNQFNINSVLTNKILSIEPLDSLDYSTSYTVYIPNNAVKDLSGNIMINDYSFSFSTQADTYPPIVTSTDPIDAETNVPIEKSITVMFNENVQPGNNFEDISLLNGNSVISTVYNISNNILTLDPAENLDYSVTYSVYVPKGSVTDIKGNGLNKNYTFNFTTKEPPDTTPPRIFSNDPIDGAVDVSINKSISLTFDEDVQQGVNYNSISLKNNNVIVPTINSITGNVLTMKPENSLDYSVTYSAYVPIGSVQDLAGNGFDSNYDFNFTTEADTVPPAIISSDPVDGANDVSTTKLITVQFSENIMPGANFNGITLKERNKTVSCELTLSNDTLVIQPNTSLKSNTPYTVTIPVDSLKDVADNVIPTDYIFSFTTTK